MASKSERDIARAARNDRVQEVVLLLAWLTKQCRGDAHLSPVVNATATSTMNYVVCIHEDGKRLAWRISDFEKLEYFKHLSVQQCERGLSRADKMDFLADILSR